MISDRPQSAKTINNTLHYNHDVQLYANSFQDLDLFIKTVLKLPDIVNYSANFDQQMLSEYLKSSKEQTSSEHDEEEETNGADFLLYSRFRVRKDQVLSVKFDMHIQSFPLNDDQFKDRASLKIITKADLLVESWKGLIVLADPQENCSGASGKSLNIPEVFKGTSVISKRYSDFTSTTVNQVIKEILDSLRESLQTKDYAFSIFQGKNVDNFNYNPEEDPTDVWIIDDIAKEIINRPSSHSNLSEGYQRLLVGKPEDKIFSEFKSSLKKAITKHGQNRLESIKFNDKLKGKSKEYAQKQQGLQKVKITEEMIKADILLHGDLINVICKDIALSRLYSDLNREPKLKLLYGLPEARFSKILEDAMSPIIQKYLKKFQEQKNLNEPWIVRKKIYRSEFNKSFFAFASEFTQEVLESIGNGYFTNLPFQNHLTLAVDEHNFLNKSYISLMLGCANEEETQQMCLYLTNKLTQMKDRESKSRNNGYLIGKALRNKRHYTRRNRSFVLEQIETLESFSEIIQGLAKRFVLSLSKEPLSIGDIKCYLGIRQQNQGQQAHVEFCAKLQSIRENQSQTIVKIEKKKATYKLEDMIPLFNIQTGPQLLNRAFKLYFVKIIYFYGMEDEVRKLRRELSMLKVLYNSYEQIHIQMVNTPIYRNYYSTFMDTNHPLKPDLYLFVYPKEEEHYATLANVLSTEILSRESKNHAILYLPSSLGKDKLSKKSPAIAHICESNHIQMLSEAEVIGIHIRKIIRRKTLSDNAWQEMYKDAFMDMNRFRNPMTGTLAYEDVRNLFNGNVLFGGFDEDFGKEHLEPLVKTIKTREELIKLHFGIYKTIEQTTEDLSQKAARCLQKIEFAKGEEGQEPMKEELGKLKAELEKNELRLMKLRMMTMSEEDLEDTNENPLIQKILMEPQMMRRKLAKNSKTKGEIAKFQDQADDLDKKIKELGEMIQKLNQKQKEFCNVEISYVDYCAYELKKIQHSTYYEYDSSFGSLNEKDKKYVVPIEKWFFKNGQFKQEIDISVEILAEFLDDLVEGKMVNRKSSLGKKDAKQKILYSSLKAMIVEPVQMASLTKSENLVSYLKEKSQRTAEFKILDLQVHSGLQEKIAEAILKENSVTADFISKELRELINAFGYDHKDLDDDSNKKEENARLLKTLDFVNKVGSRLEYIRSKHESKKISLINMLTKDMRKLNVFEQSLAKDKTDRNLEDQKIMIQELVVEKMKRLNLSLFITKVLEEKLQVFSETRDKIQDITKENTRKPTIMRIQFENRLRKVKDAIILSIQQTRKSISENETDRKKLIEALEQLEKAQIKKDKELFISLPISNSRREELFEKCSKEEAAKLKDYYIQFKKTIRNYHSVCVIAESNIFELKKEGSLKDSFQQYHGYYEKAKHIAGKIADWKWIGKTVQKTLDGAEWVEKSVGRILSFVPYGKVVFETLQSVWNYRRDIIKMNEFQTFSDMISSPAALEEILEVSVLTLMIEKKHLILKMSETLEMGFMDQAENWIKKRFIKEQNLYQGLRTGAKVMGSIDAACVITNAYTNFIHDCNQTTGIDPRDDIDGVGKTTKIFIECARKVDLKAYSHLFGAEVPPQIKTGESKRWYQYVVCGASTTNKKKAQKTQIAPQDQNSITP